MQYQGGKHRLSKYLLPQIQAYLHSESIYYEPFVGSAAIASKIECKEKHLSDICEPLINMFKALQNGWIPPDSLTEEEYKSIKSKMDFKDPLTAFAGFGCSFGGKWFGGYARKNDNPTEYQQDYAGLARSSLIKSISQDMKFEHKSYDQITGVEGAVFYCDPPYQGTLGYQFGKNFSHDQFWRWANQTAEANTVLVSEFYCPDSSWECIWELKRYIVTAIGISDNSRVEKLFMKGW